MSMSMSMSISLHTISPGIPTFIFLGFMIFQPRNKIYPYYFVYLAPPRAYSRLRVSCTHHFFLSRGSIAFCSFAF